MIIRGRPTLVDRLQLKIDETAIPPTSNDTTNPADPLLQMLDSFGQPSSAKKSLVRSFAHIANDHFTKQIDKGKYSTVNQKHKASVCKYLFQTTLKIINEVAKDKRFHGIAQIARVVLAVPISNAMVEEAFCTLIERIKGSDPNATLLDGRLLVHLNAHM